jgi:hypothetical protein
MTLDTVKQNLKNYAFLSQNALGIIDQSWQKYIEDSAIAEEDIKGYWIDKSSRLYRDIQSILILQDFDQFQVESYTV